MCIAREEVWKSSWNTKCKHKEDGLLIYDLGNAGSFCFLRIMDVNSFQRINVRFSLRISAYSWLFGLWNLMKQLRKKISLNVLFFNLTSITSIKNSWCFEDLETCTYEGRFQFIRIMLPNARAARSYVWEAALGQCS